jgi:short-subunit dehydrogenase
MIHHFIKATNGRGTVINLVSLAASLLVPGMSSFSASHLALIKLTECLDLGKLISLSSNTNA